MESPKTEEERSDDEEQHAVEICQPCCLAKSPVTPQHYQALMQDNPCWLQAGPGGAAR